MLFGLYETLIYLSMHTKLKQHQSVYIRSLLHDLIHILHFPICIIKKLDSQYFIRYTSAFVKSSTCNGLS